MSRNVRRDEICFSSLGELNPKGDRAMIITRFNPERGPEGGPEQERPCPDCAGKGVDQKGQTCSRCNGSGVILKR